MPVNMPAPPPAVTPSSPAPAAPAAQPAAAPAVDKGPPPSTSKGLDDMFDRIGEKYGRDPDEILNPPGENKGKPKAKPAEPVKEAEKVEPKTEQPEEDEDDPVKGPEAKAPEAKPEAKPAKDGKKANPWKLLDEAKASRAALEKENAELRKVIPDEPTRKAETARIKKLEDEHKELLEKIRFYDYQQHPEFKEKYEKPYTDKWGEIWSEISSVNVQDGETQRRVEPSDIAKLGNLPAPTLIKEAKALFGEDAGPWVAERIRELRNLAKAKADALEKVKTEGADRMAKEQETLTKEQHELNSTLEQNWVKANEELEGHSKYGEFLKAKEGDEEHNQAVERGTEFVKKAWTLDPREKGISPEERTARLKRQVKLQRYAAGFASLYLSEQRWRSKAQELETKLQQYEASSPKTEGGGKATSNSPQQNGYTLDSFEAALQAKARPMI